MGYSRRFDKGPPDHVIKKHFKAAGVVKSVEMKKRNAIITFANAQQAQKAIDELHESTIDGQSQCILVRAEPFLKGSKGAKKNKWHNKGGNRTQKGHLKQSSGGKGGGKDGKMAMMAAMMNMMMSGNWW